MSNIPSKATKARAGKKLAPKRKMARRPKTLQPTTKNVPVAPAAEEPRGDYCGAPLTVTLSPPTADLVRWGARTLRVFPAAVVEGALFGRLENVKACHAEEGWGDDAFLWFMRDVTGALIEDDVRSEYAGAPGEQLPARQAEVVQGAAVQPLRHTLPGEAREPLEAGVPATAPRRVTLEFSEEAFALLEANRKHDGLVSVEEFIRDSLRGTVGAFCESLDGESEEMRQAFARPGASE